MTLQKLSAFFCSMPLHRFLQMSAEHIKEGECILKIPFASHLIGDPVRPAIHGGILATLADSAGGLAVFSRAGMSAKVSTIDMRVDYLRPGLPQDLYCSASVVRIGNRVGVTTMRVYQHRASVESSRAAGGAATEGEEYVVAEARGVYNILLDRAERKPLAG